MCRLIRESVRPYIGRLGWALLFMAIVAASTTFSAYLMKPVVNDIFVNRDEGMLWLIGGAVLATFAVKGVASYLQAVLMARVGLSIVADLQNRLFAHLARMDLSFFHNRPTGELISRFTIDINQMRMAVSNVLTGIGKDSLSLIGLVGSMFLQNWQLALIALFIFPIAIRPIARLGKRMRKVTANTQKEMGLLTAILEQTFQGIRVVKAYGMAEYEKGRVATIVDTVRRLSRKAESTRARSHPIMETLGGVAVAIVIIYGGNQVIEGQTDAGSFFSFITALLLAYEPMKRLANLNMSLQQGLAGAQRLFEVLDTEPAILDKPNAKPLAISGGTIELKQVEFAYGPGAPAVNGVFMEVAAGKTVALVGPSGAGKSTILNLIPRFYDVDAGSVTIDGMDVRDVTMSSLHAGIALVSQEVMLFDDTVRANIAYGRAGAGEDGIVEAAKFAAAHEFIESLPEGYDTVVGEQGVKLSGGQRQRLAIARAMLKNAPILLLDEATSALDTESERQVQAALKNLMSGRTTLVIAHRLSTVVDADLIYVIDNGRIIEAGSHGDLLERDGAYAKLYWLQFAEQNGAEAVAATPI
ncbi:MAG: lipid A export permease/ATP-binding protein MsbA [Rhodospirillales bacterium]|nr:lipid A export permease/ATP-binding protein MsbA [Rhodospirillales bacterium]